MPGNYALKMPNLKTCRNQTFPPLRIIIENILQAPASDFDALLCSKLTSNKTS
jgi:hypothetical protein